MKSSSKDEDQLDDPLISTGEFLWLKSNLNRHRCDYFISTKKLTVWSRRTGGFIKTLFGALAEVEGAYLYNAPEFEICWDQVVGITKGRWGLAPKFTIKLKNRNEFIFLVNAYGEAQQKLIAGLQQATGINLTA